MTEEKSIVKLKIEDGLKLIRGMILPVLQRNEYVVFDQGEVTFIPMEMLPNEVFTAMKSKITKIQQNLRAQIVPNTKLSEPINIKVTTSDEDRLNELKVKGVRYRGSRAECITVEEVERYRLNERIKKRRARSKAQVNQQTQTQTHTQFEQKIKPINAQSSQSLTIEIIPSDNKIELNTSVVDNILRNGHIVSCSEYTNVTPINEIREQILPVNINNSLNLICSNGNTPLPNSAIASMNNNPHLTFTTGDKSLHTSAIVPNTVSIVNLAKLLSEEASIRDIHSRLKPDEQIEIITWAKRRHPVDGLPFGTILKLNTIHEKLIKIDDRGLLLNIRDEELLKELNTFIHFYK